MKRFAVNIALDVCLGDGKWKKQWSGFIFFLFDQTFITTGLFIYINF